MPNPGEKHNKETDPEIYLRVNEGLSQERASDAPWWRFGQLGRIAKELTQDLSPSENPWKEEGGIVDFQLPPGDDGELAECHLAYNREITKEMAEYSRWESFGLKAKQLDVLRPVRLTEFLITKNGQIVADLSENLREHSVYVFTQTNKHLKPKGKLKEITGTHVPDQGLVIMRGNLLSIKGLAILFHELLGHAEKNDHETSVLRGSVARDLKEGVKISPIKKKLFMADERNPWVPGLKILKQVLNHELFEKLLKDTHRNLRNYHNYLNEND
jgi:hypothetical protein